MKRKLIDKRGITLRRDGFSDERHVILPKDVVEESGKMPIVRDLLPCRIGHFPYAAGHMVRRVQPMEEWVLIYCAEGRGWCGFDDRHWRIGPDIAFVLPAGAAHSYGTTKKSPWSIYWVHMIGGKVREYLTALGYSRDNPLIHLKHGGELIHHFEELYCLLHYGHSPSVLLALSTSLAHFLGELNLQRIIPGSSVSVTEDNVMATIPFMRRNLSRSLTLQELAEFARLSVPHYTSIFRRRTGISPIKFFLRMKMQKAAVMLGEPGRRVKDVAMQLGISDPYYFSRLFRRVTGKAPSALLRNELSSEEQRSPGRI